MFCEGEPCPAIRRISEELIEIIVDPEPKPKPKPILTPKPKPMPKKKKKPPMDTLCKCCRRFFRQLYDDTRRHYNNFCKYTRQVLHIKKKKTPEELKQYYINQSKMYVKLWYISEANRYRISVQRRMEQQIRNEEIKQQLASSRLRNSLVMLGLDDESDEEPPIRDIEADMEYQRELQEMQKREKKLHKERKKLYYSKNFIWDQLPLEIY